MTLQNLELTLKDREFSGENPILIFEFLTNLVEDTDTLYINAGELMAFKPHRLSVSACDQLRTAANGSRSGNSGFIFHNPEAVQHLLRTYANEAAISEVIDNFLNVHQKNLKTDKNLPTRPNNATYVCGNVHD